MLTVIFSALGVTRCLAFFICQDAELGVPLEAVDGQFIETSCS